MLQVSKKCSPNRCRFLHFSRSSCFSSSGWRLVFCRTTKVEECTGTKNKYKRSEECYSFHWRWNGYHYDHSCKDLWWAEQRNVGRRKPVDLWAISKCGFLKKYFFKIRSSYLTHGVWCLESSIHNQRAQSIYRIKHIKWSGINYPGHSKNAPERIHLWNCLPFITNVSKMSNKSIHCINIKPLHPWCVNLLW